VEFAARLFANDSFAEDSTLSQRIFRASTADGGTFDA
jgi:hypothetical protein